jgi:hypothetical protein
MAEDYPAGIDGVLALAFLALAAERKAGVMEAAAVSSRRAFDDLQADVCRFIDDNDMLGHDPESRIHELGQGLKDLAEDR